MAGFRFPISGRICWDSASLNSRSPGACQICSGAVRSAEPDLQRAFGSWEAGACGDLPSRFLWRSFRFLAASNFPNTPTPRGGAPKKFEFLISRECACCTRSLNRLGFVIVPRYPPAGGLGPAYARTVNGAEARKLLNGLFEESNRRYVSWYDF